MARTTVATGSLASTRTAGLVLERAASTRSAPRLRHYASLDGLRALAVTAVLVFHVGECWQHALASTGLGRALYRLTDMGYVGVDLFFVLSGFLITGILLESRGREGYFRSFYARRTLRIFPLYYAFLLAMALAALALPQLPGGRQFLSNFAWYALYVPNLVFMREGYPPLEAVHHLWSLAIEEQFYLVWPAVVALVAPRRLLGWTALGVLAVWLGRALWLELGAAPIAVYVGTPTRVDALLMGACLALMREHAALRSVAARWAPRLLALGALASGLLMAMLHGLSAGELEVQRFGFAAFAVAFTGAVGTCVTLQERGRSPRWLNARPVQRVGKLSYGIYLFHWPVALGISALTARVLPSGLPGFALSLALTGLLSFGLAELSYRLLEAPLLALKQRYPRPA